MTIPPPDTRCLSLAGYLVTWCDHGTWRGVTHVTDERRVSEDEAEWLRMVILEERK